MLHIERLSQSIDRMGKRLLKNISDRESDLTIASSWIKDNPSIYALIEQLNTFIERDQRWDGAIPCTDQPLTTTISVNRSHPDSVTVIGVDGSQIFPDRHAAVQYYLIQCGALIYRYDGGLPEPRSIEQLYYEDDVLFDARGYLISNEAIGIERTVQEMQFVADLCADERAKHPHTRIFALVDGPLLWPHPEHGQQVTSDLASYMDGLNSIRQTGAVPVGYIDRPGGKWFLNTLWINQLPEKISLIHDEVCPLQSLTDARLMGVMLAPGERTPWFKRHNQSQSIHSRADQEIWFCYLNLGQVNKPSIARIEVPKWFAEQQNEIMLLQNVLLHQAYALNGYPYVLARAHEQALVTTQDKAAFDAILERTLMEQGIMPQISEKARQKSYLGHR